MQKGILAKFNLFLISTFVCILNACSSGTSSPVATSNETTTIMVYIIGSDLESKKDCPGNIGCATYNIQQMMQVGSTSNMNVVIETGGSTANGWNFVNRFLVESNQLLWQQTLGPVNMATSNQITNFINWSVANYPAGKYILVFWGHAGGPNGGYGGDDNFPTGFNANGDPIGSLISLPNIITAVQNSNTQFQIIGFDACMMGSTEVASGLAPYAQYYIGSEDLSPGAGWNYTSFLQYVTNNPNANGAQIGTVIAQGFAEQNAGQPITLSVINTELANNLVTAVNNFATALASYVNSTPANWMALASARLKSFDFNTSVFFSVDNSNLTSDLVDLVNFATVIQSSAPFSTNSSLQSAINALISAVSDSVSYNQVTPGIRNGANGLTVYFPSIMAQYQTKYFTTNTQNTPFYQSAYTGIVNAYANYYTQNSSLLTSQIQGSLAKNDNIISAQLTNQPAQVFALGNGQESCSLSVDNKTTSVVPCYTSLQLAFATPSGSGSEYTVSFNQEGTQSTSWPTITDANGNTSNIIMIPNDTSSESSVAAVAYFLVPVSRVNINETPLVINSTGYLLVQNKNGVLTAVNYQTGASSNTQNVYALESQDGFYLRKYALSNDVWQMLTDLSVLYKQPYTIKFNGSVQSGTNFAYVVSDLTGAVYSPESISY